MTTTTSAARLAARTLLTLALAATLAPTSRAQTASPWGAPDGAKATGKYADVNGIKLYYEVHGTSAAGQAPLVLLHGGLGAGSMFGPNIAALAKGRQVILVDLQGHGRTADIDRPITPELMADDISALLTHLKVGQADVMGYSLGGGVALNTAARHPEQVHRLVLVSTVLRPDGFYPEMRTLQKAVNGSIAEQMKGTPMYALYKSVAPRPQDFPRLLDKLGAFMRADFDYTPQLASVKAPTLLVIGDGDMVMPAHAVEAFAVLDGGKRDGGWDGAGRSKRGQLAVLPGLTHYTIFDAPALAEVAGRFLDAKP
ncbi:MAG: menaquinone biosynthesis related protein MenX [Gemmatimonadetes bacterium]|nr:menaquinone biosynthesis related protein MenX [Gemmatimonadota bacterium]